MSRILIWTSSYPPIMGGLQTVTSQLANELSAKGHDVLVLTNRNDKQHSEEEIHHEGRLKIKRVRHWSPYKMLPGLRGNLLHIIGKILFPVQRRKIWKMVDAFSPEVVNIHFPSSQLPYWNGEQASIRKSRLVISFHGHDVTQWFKTEDSFVSNELREELNETEKEILLRFKELLSRADAISTCSKWLMSLVHKYGIDLSGKECVPLYNAVSLERYQKHYEKPVKDRYIFAFGRLEYHKGFDLLIQAFNELPSNLRNGVKLIIGGEGIYRDVLTKQVKNNRDANDVIFTGRLSPEDVVKYVQNSELIVIPSRREPFGITVLEALASGKPVVTTNVGGLPEVGGGYASICNPTSEDLHKKIIKVLELKTRNIEIEKKANLKNYLEQFSLSNFVVAYEDLLTGNWRENGS